MQLHQNHETHGHIKNKGHDKEQCSLIPIHPSPYQVFADTGTPRLLIPSQVLTRASPTNLYDQTARISRDTVPCRKLQSIMAGQLNNQTPQVFQTYWHWHFVRRRSHYKQTKFCWFYWASATFTRHFFFDTVQDSVETCSVPFKKIKQFCRTNPA